jgi:N4-gp56 family major capsid protein
MAAQTYSTQAGRVNTIKGEILAHSIPKEVLGITGQIKKMPKNEGDNVKYRRWLPQDATNDSTDGYGNRFITGSNVDTYASDHQTTEGVTQTAVTMAATDVTATLLQYSCLYMLTDKTADLYEDDVAGEMKKQTGERMGLVREMIRYGKLKAATNKYYAGGTSYATVDETLTLPLLRRVSRNLLANHADQINEVIEASTKFNTTPVEAGFLVFCHTDMEPAIRDLPGFKHVSEYANRSTINENEIGSCERYRFILSPELAPWYGSNATYRGALIGATGLQGTSTYIDVYPCIVVADKAWGDVALRGMGSFDMTYLPVDQKDKNDPLGQRGYIGAKFWSAAEILNQGYMAVVFAGTPDLA